VWGKANEVAEIRCEGVGLFVLGCCINHSCAPNVMICKRDNVNELDGFIDLDSTMAFVALHDIQENEELFISYIDESLPLDERSRLLSDYHFTCQCQKCQNERHQINNDNNNKNSMK